jgi:lipopolysaccharide transport system ATP-binding protein
MSSDFVIRTDGLGKVYRLYARPEDRIKQFFLPHKTYGRDFWALQNINLEVKRGETLGIIGRNGSGKSTLLHLICGTVQPTTGDLEVRGRIATLLELGAGFNPEFTGRENAILNATILGLSNKEIEEKLPLIEAFADIGPFIDQPVRQYSSGMSARLGFAVCAHIDADILVVDEVFAVGDAAFQQRCMRFLYNFRARGTLLFVSHDESAVLSLCDRAIWLDRGQVRAGGACREICQRYHSFLQSTEAGGDHGDGAVVEWVPSGPTKVVDEASFGLDRRANWSRTEAPIIVGATLSRPDGKPAPMVDSGDEVSVSIDLCATRDVDEPVVGFVVRNRMGQVIFGDNTAQMTQPAPSRLMKGQRLRATFRFRMPHLMTGDYAVEADLFERANKEPLDRFRDSLTVHVSSHPFMGGLANVVMRQTRFVIGSGSSARIVTSAAPATPRPLIQDERWQGKNLMEALPFRADAPSHGHGGARIEQADFFHLDGSPATRIQGGQEIELRICARTQRPLTGPIIGFMLRNALGQNVFGENTFIPSRNTNRHTAEGEPIVGHFRFQMPYLPAGEYMLAPSIIDGTQQDHIHVHWMEKALTLQVITSPVSRSVIGVPMLDIRLDLEPDEAERNVA